MAKQLSITNGITALKIPENVRVTAVMFNGQRQPYRFTKERHLQTREAITGVVEVSFEKIKVSATLKPVEVAAYYPMPARP